MMRISYQLRHWVNYKGSYSPTCPTPEKSFIYASNKSFDGDNLQQNPLTGYALSIGASVQDATSILWDESGPGMKHDAGKPKYSTNWPN